MKTEIKAYQATGKVVQRFIYSELTTQMIICFEDNTFTCFGIPDPDPYDNPEIENESLDYFSFNFQQLIEAGIASKQELENMVSEKQKAKQGAAEQHERREYLRLKAKYARRGKGKRITQIAIRRTNLEGD